MSDLATYSSLFLSALSAATLLPGSSEALLAGFVATEQGVLVLLLTVATIANVAGSAVNWGLGRFSSFTATEIGFQCRSGAIVRRFDGMNGLGSGRDCLRGFQ